MKILESFIPALNKNIMQYAQQLHQPYIVSFDNSFKCSVSLCGYNNDIPLSSLSTGQLKTVDMMIILGILGTVIGSASANVIFLDELFSNLDGNLRNDMCSVLKNFITDGDTIFVISHQDLDDRYFNGTIKLHIDYKGQFEKHTTTTIIKNGIE
jgi:ABC-type multidrug transport system ATPase subunit